MIGAGYTGGVDTRLFSRAPKSPAAATPWRRRRRHKKTAPRISATPRRPPITPPRMAPLLLRGVLDEDAEAFVIVPGDIVGGAVEEAVE